VFEKANLNFLFIKFIKKIKKGKKARKKPVYWTVYNNTMPNMRLL
jgi:hypothetical protein